MDQYRKAAVAALGALAQILVVLDSAADAGVLPESWRPWIVVAVALGTALGVERVPNAPGRHEA